MRTIKVSGQNMYEIHIGSGLIDKAGCFIKKLSSAQKVMIITDTNVLNLYEGKVRKSLENEGFEVFCFAFPAGETNKTFDTVKNMIDALSEAQLTRNDLVVALGGGVVGDMAGFASSIYLRGIDFVQIPTTLLSQVDSSVGGKTGCDLPSGKNLVGAFHNPRLVLIDTDTLKTLPERYKRDGLGEVVKCGCIRSVRLFEMLENCQEFDEILNQAIYECVDIKRVVVENDFTEKGERMLLNFGHTLAHAIEKYYNFASIAHGEAVSIGMYQITKASESLGYTEKGTAERIENLLKKFELPKICEADIEKLVDIMLHDKKRRGKNINLVLLKGIGESFIEEIPTEKLTDFFRRGYIG